MKCVYCKGSPATDPSIALIHVKPLCKACQGWKTPHLWVCFDKADCRARLRKAKKLKPR